MAATASDGGAHKQWTSSSNLQEGQACPEPGGKDSALSKTVSTEMDASKKHANNSNATTLSPSGYKDTPIFIEACAGCGILSSMVQQKGFQIIPIDCPRNRHVPKCRLVILDLTTQHAEQLLHRIVEDYNVACVHIALPCGTCSRARGIPLPDGSPGPPPLRDANHLHGLEGLSAVDAAKVQAANDLYAWADRFIQFLHSRGVHWTIENPANSWLWELPEMSFALAHGHFVKLHACAYGGERKKNTAFLCSSSHLCALEKFCDGSHPHKGWGYDFEKGEFNTAKEAEYPRALCEQYAVILERMVFGTNERRQTDAALDKFRPNQQVKGRGVPQIISEFAAVRSLVSSASPPLTDKKLLARPWLGVPTGAKLLRTEAKGGEMHLFVFGFFRSMQQFVSVAKQLWHPFDELRNLPDCLIRCLFNCLSMGPVEMTKQRIQTLQLWTEWEKELRSDEQKLHDKLHGKVANVLKGKKLLLLEKLATHINWPDKQLHQELRDGFKLTGYAALSGVFKTDLKPGLFNKEQLMQDAKFLKPLLLGKVASPLHADEHAEELFGITVKEAVEKNWLEGPYSVSEVDAMFDRWLPVRRFSVFQKGKVRPIDDMKENRLNQSFSSGEKIDLHALDHTVWCLQIITKFCIHGGNLDFCLSDGSRLRAAVHAAWKGLDPKLVTTAFDLESAYKQLALHPTEYDCTVVVLRDPKTQRPACFLMRTLPFGSVASVLHFNRTARLLWRLGLELNLWWSNYFDDFPCVAHCSQVGSTQACVEGLFQLLGFKFASDKLAPFSTSTEMLGVLVDTAERGVIKVDNKESRKQDLVAELQKILQCGVLEADRLPAILGRVQYAEMRIAGRHGKLAMADIRDWEKHGNSKEAAPLDETSREAFEILLARIDAGRPKRLVADEPQRPVLVFTDGAVETGSDGQVEATVGGVIFADGQTQTFGSHVDESVLRGWLQELVHPVGLTELYGIVVALKQWQQLLKGRRVIIFCDNWTAIDVYIKGTSSLKLWRQMLLEIETLDSEADNLVWMARVPSSSNVADPPSRGRWDEIDFLQPFDICFPCCPVTGKALRSLKAEANRGQT